MEEAQLVSDLPVEIRDEWHTIERIEKSNAIVSSSLTVRLAHRQVSHKFHTSTLTLTLAYVLSHFIDMSHLPSLTVWLAHRQLSHKFHTQPSPSP